MDSILAITGFGSVLKEGASAHLDDKRRHYLDMILDSTNHMNRLADDLLAFSRME
jgi:signal transduction histidine kinase